MGGRAYIHKVIFNTKRKPLKSAFDKQWLKFLFRYIKVKKHWIMRHARNDDFLAISRTSESSLLLGTHLWEVHNDSTKCTREGKNTYFANLTLHACSTDNFACDNAFCIPMEKRCDAIEDCVDGSDEHDCGKLIIREGYKKELAPLLKSGENIKVNFSLSLLDIEPNEQTNTFSSRISYTRNWFDERLRYKYLKRESGGEMNSLLSDEIDLIWFPFMIFYNMKTLEDFKKTDVPDVSEVIPNKTSTILAANNMHTFNGSENALSLIREYNVEWKTVYAYHWYPFDTQVCQMQIMTTVSKIEMRPVNLEYNHNISLDRYTLSKIRMCNSAINNKKAIIVEVNLGRPIVNNLLTVFVPTMLLVIISFTARLFAEEYIDMVVQVNVTVMLALATM